MKYTDTFFTFPIKIYDGFSVRKNIRKEELLMDELDSAFSDDWVEGVAEIPLKEYKGCCDYFSTGRKVEEVAKGGFDITLVMTHSMGDFICSLPRKEFKQRLNDFAEKYEKMIEKLAEEAIREKLAMQPIYIPSKKKPWYKRIFL